MTDFIQFPPDSTGKKARHSAVTELTISTEYLKPKIGDIITGAISGATGKFVGDSRTETVIYNLSDTNGNFQAGENLTVSNVLYAVLFSTTGQIYTQTSSIIDAERPTHSLKIDARGAANVRFTEGEPQFDAYGRIQVAQMQIVAEHYFVSEDQPGKYWNRTTGSTGTFTYLPQKSSVRLQLGTTSGDRVSRTTNQYHPYKPATSQLIYMGLSLGDNGKANVQRQWGYFDDFNGIGFRMQGMTLQVFLRSDVNGTVQEEIVNQEDWNGVRLNDATLSEYILDVSKPNTYWMDISYSRIRMGVLSPNGSRVTVHSFEMGNSTVHLSPRTFTLPIRWSMANTGTSASTSEMYLTFGTVFTEIADIKYSGVLIHTAPPEPVPIANNGKYNPFLSFRAKLTINGLPNRIVGIHEDFDWCSIGGSPLHIGIFVFPNESYLENVRWSNNIAPATMLEVDRNCTSVVQYQSWITSAEFTGSISGTTLTVTALSSGMIEDDQYIVGAGILPDTKIIGYISGNGGTGTYVLNKSQTLASTTFTAHYSIKPIESFIASPDDADRIRLGDRMEKSFGLAADGVSQACFVFAAKVVNPSVTEPVSLFYTKYWKEIR
jgi:hypothetical protein